MPAEASAKAGDVLAALLAEVRAANRHAAMMGWGYWGDDAWATP